MLRQGLPILLLALLAGCNSASVRPDAPDGAGTVTPAGAGDADAGAPAPAKVPAGKPGAASAADDELVQRLDQLAGRLTLVQEQLIELKAQGAELSLQSQQLLARMQMAGPAPAQEMAPETPPASSDTAPAQLDGLIDQLGMIANELSASGVGDSYRLAADYTRSGQWVLIRYDRFSGESWLADQGSWQSLQDPVAVPASDYEVVLERADNDIKGYVAARLDRRSGETWWLKQDTWQKFD
ncbi:hypothetical protein GCM10011348_40800 [Marinobacterium nitratireducens]|uniref:Lipoprotein n=1 Tax=Marinobacterium nitratireducens TaxID=518897 RepID=A0A918DXN8_9GAMM|nr:hypothetical protein [Marinobacterium nitratireducens]GGO87489.1 hypothetical protein GCM10011348_40800 [Marinobacterium nitratireducens]